MAQTPAQHAIGRFLRPPDVEEEPEDPEVPGNSMVEPIDGVIDVNSVREQLQDFKMEPCGTHDFRNFKDFTMSNLLHAEDIVPIS